MAIEDRYYLPEELKCEECGQHIGWIYVCDNQSEFVCDGCATKITDNLVRPKRDSDESWQASEALLKR